MDDFKFNSLHELYQKLMPALKTKLNDIYRNKVYYIKVEDIWDYLRKTSWSKSNDLNLAEMVDDILNVSIYQLTEYIHANLKNVNTNNKDENLL